VPITQMLPDGFNTRRQALSQAVVNASYSWNELN
jgi:hypothetical protein